MVLKTRRQRTTVAVVCIVALLSVGVGAVATERPNANDGLVNQPTTTQAEGPITIRNLSAPSRVRVGTNYTVSAEIVNRADERETRQASYRIAGTVIKSRLVVLPGT